MPTVRFAIGDPAAKRDYEVDELKVRLETEGAEYTYLDETVEVEVRRVRMAFEMAGVFESDSSDAPTGVGLWFTLLQGTPVTFYPSGSGGPSVSVVPVLKHTPTVYSLKQGMKLRRNSLKFVEDEWRSPGDSHFNDFKTLIANL